MILAYNFILSCVLNLSASYYCNQMGCPGFSLIATWNVRSVSANEIVIDWEPRKEFSSSITNYEVLWSAAECVHCNGKMVLEPHQTVITISVEACRNYTIEIYGYDSTQQQNVPAVFSQVTESDPLSNGTAVIVSGTWVILRWLQNRSCPNSTYMAVCHGANTIVQFERHPTESVVLFNISGLYKQSRYTCEAFTFNSAGSSAKSNKIYISTNDSFGDEENNTSKYILTAGLILPFCIAATIITILVKKGSIKVPWRGRYILTDNESEYATTHENV